MARQIKVGLNSGEKGTRSGAAGKILSRLLAHKGLETRILTLMAMLSENSTTVPTTLEIKAEPRSFFPEDVLYKRMQMLR